MLHTHTVNASHYTQKVEDNILKILQMVHGLTNSHLKLEKETWTSKNIYIAQIYLSFLKWFCSSLSFPIVTCIYFHQHLNYQSPHASANVWPDSIIALVKQSAAEIANWRSLSFIDCQELACDS